MTETLPRRVAVTVARHTPLYFDTCTLLGLPADGPQAPKTHRITADQLAGLELPGPLCLAKARALAENAADLDIVVLDPGQGDASLTSYLGGQQLADVRDAHTTDWARCLLRKALGDTSRTDAEVDALAKALTTAGLLNVKFPEWLHIWVI